MLVRGAANPPLTAFAARVAAGGFADASWQSRRIDPTEAISGLEHYLLLFLFLDHRDERVIRL
jgi:hypothetical protein